jgi:ParB family chromosome partitioning protein
MVTAAGFFHRQYGRFSYSHLKRTPWIQTFAQPFRLRAPAESARSKALLESVLYMQVMDSGSSEGKPIRPGPNPHITKDDRILDFGCGQGDYVKLLLSMGYNIRGMEFFRRAGNMLDTGAVRRMCDAIARDIRKNGLYDVVICDSVVNSVDTLEAEADVVTCLNAFTKPGHKIFFSGRQVEGIEQKGRATRAALAGQRGVEFFDENGFSGLFREGTWFYQKFHTKVQANALCAKYLGEPHYGCHSPGWQIATTKTVGLTVEQRADSIRREFNLPWPDGESVGKGDEMVAAWREAIVISGSD